MNGVISDFGEGFFDNCCCLPVKHAIILFAFLPHVLVAIIATPHHVAHLQITLNKHLKWSGKLPFGVLSSFYSEKLKIKTSLLHHSDSLFSTHSHLSHR